METQIENIKNISTQILSNNLKFWRNLLQRKVVLDNLITINSENNAFLESGIESWKKIQHQLQYKKKWKFLYVWFRLYIQNKKIKQQMIESFEGTLINENDVFQEEMKVEKKLDDDKSEKSIIFDAEEQLDPV